MKKRKPILVDLPCWFVKDAPVNFPLEILAATNTPLVLKHEKEMIAVKPATIGFFVLLEWTASAFFKDPATAPPDAIFRAVACANLGRELFPLDRAKLDRESERIAKTAGMAILSNYATLCEWLLSVPFYGYMMLRNQGKSTKKEKFLFAGPGIAAVVNIGTQTANLTPEEAIWNFPLALAGHLAAVNDCGKLDPARPKDKADLEQKAKEAVEREKRGELHPWQIAEPDLYPLSFRQKRRQIELEKQRNATNET